MYRCAGGLTPPQVLGERDFGTTLENLGFNDRPRLLQFQRDVLAVLANGVRVLSTNIIPLE